MAWTYSTLRQYKKWLAIPGQPRRPLKEVKQIALEELRKQGLSNEVKVKVTRDLSSDLTRAEYEENGNVMKLHPINRFATKSDLRGTVNHEIARYRDEYRDRMGVRRRAKEY